MTKTVNAQAEGLRLAKYSVGVGDRFAHQAKAQLRACVLAAEHGLEIVPVWNKSNREHTIVGSKPGSVRAAAEAAVRALQWQKPFYIDADHINLKNVDGFLQASDFFTIDVAEEIGRPAPEPDVKRFVASHPELLQRVQLTGIDCAIEISLPELTRIAHKYLFAAQEAGRIYRHIEAAKGKGKFITEVSMDETDAPQTPAELLVILAALAGEKVPAQTVAPKFTGRFNKGVDYVGDVEQFEREFVADLAVIAHAVKHYGLPANLKLSVHSGSDKFSIYASIRRAVRQAGAGVHVKTAGTTWLEELIGLAEAGGEGLAVAKTVYREAWHRREALCAPYASVIDIDPGRLPHPSEVDEWRAETFVAALRHIPSEARYNADLRQLLHVGYKVAAELGERYLQALAANEASIARNVTENILQRHLLRVFPARG